ncbi:PREDICTED: ras-related protein Rab-39B, partial [Phaethon lepturus]|uniref:ras-related protein Rab-39B n=1 Tax=Phaethon lepturus TaxID=97097 RepID=UPI0005305AA0
FGRNKTNSHADSPRKLLYHFAVTREVGLSAPLSALAVTVRAVGLTSGVLGESVGVVGVPMPRPWGSITRAYYRNSVGGLLLFDITNRRSFQNVHEWLEETKVHVQPYQIVFVLVGHKCDLDTQRQVTRHEAEKLAAAYGMKYIETSARDAINVEKAFTDLTRDIYELVKRGEISIQEGWEGVKSGFVPNVVHSSEEVVKSDRRCLC